MEERLEEFEEIKTDSDIPQNQNDQEPQTRIRLPRKGEILGIVTQRLGGNRMEIKCSDGKTRNCRVPGRFRRKFWLRQGDAVLITVWPDDDNKGDIIYQYKKGSDYQLKKLGFLKNLDDKF